jgi:hypothetical protein
MKRASPTSRNTLIMLMVLILLMAGCPGKQTTTTTEATTTTTEPTTTTEATTLITTTTTTTTTSLEIIITTTTTSTTTLIAYQTTSTIANAVCYMNSDCGLNKIEYVCRIALPAGAQQMGNGQKAVFRVEFTKLCIEPGSPYARCDTKRHEALWEICGTGKTCAEGCYTCVDNKTRYCPPPEVKKKPTTTTTTLEDDE